MKIALIKRDNAYYPYYESDKELFKTQKNNVVYMAEIKQPRNLLHHKKYWALCKIVQLNKGQFKSAEQVSDYLKLKSGNVDYICVEKDTTYIKPKSINFESMNQNQFNDFWNIIIPIVCEVLQCTQEDIEENIIFEM